jgi:peptidoglycan/xylan/chitin deacetylase (PgdA/CDA1 family)
MRLILGAVIATTTIIILGVLIISPVFFTNEKPTNVMVSFEIYDQTNLEIWCQDLSNFLRSKNISGTVFISGELAKKYPSCITSFPDNFDIGSQTYSYAQLTQIPDYSLQLEEVKQGRDAINEVGNFDSKLFKAPYGDTNENIYSLLSSNGILADFSYQNQYNKYHDEQFLKFDLLTFDSQDIYSEYSQIVESNNIPVQIEFDTYMTIGEIQQIILEMDSWDIKFVTASDISKMKLTERNG